MRDLSLAIVLVIAALAALLPVRAAPSPQAGVEEAGSRAGVCTVEEGSGRTSVIAAASSVDGPVRVDLFAGGSSAGSSDVETGPGGVVLVPLMEVAAVGVAGVLTELPNSDSAAVSRMLGERSLAADRCVASPSAQVVVAGGSTASGEQFSIHILNPYSADARVELTVVSETGLESSDRFEAVTVPTMDSIEVDLTALLPGREVLSVIVDVHDGDAVVFGRQESASDTAIWPGVPGAEDWFVPIGAAARNGRVLLVSPVNAAVDFQLDLYAPGGFEENYVTGSVPARGHVWVDLSDVEGDEIAVRLLSASPLVATLVLKDERATAATPGSTAAATRWFLPGAGSLEDGEESIVILNAGIDTVTVSLRSLGSQPSVAQFDVESDGVVEVAAVDADGYLVTASGPVVVAWISRREGPMALASGLASAE